jgi:hypothetical protein
VNRRLLLALASTLVAVFGLASAAESTNSPNTVCPGTYKEVTASELSVSGDRAKVVFDVAAGCKDVELTLVSYEAPGPTFDPNTADQQRVHDYKTQLFSAGTGHTMEISFRSNCYFQIDFVYGTHIEKFGPPDSNNFYYRQGRNIKSVHAGSAPCAESSPPPTVTPTSPPSSNTSPPVVQEAPPVPPPGVELVKTQRIGTNAGFVRSSIRGTAGKRIEYQLTATNTSSAAVTITIADPGCDAGTLAPAGGQLVEPGKSVVFTCSHRITKKDGSQVVNVAVATATASNGAQANDTSRVVAQVQAGAVLGAQKTVKKAAVKAKPKVTPVKKKAKPAKPVVAGASFTG